MYVPPKFALSEADTEAALARAGFAQLVTCAAGEMLVTALPLLYDPARHALVGHVARANPHWKAAGAPTVAIFAGPHAYISPSFYATKAETGKVVPTWDYETLTVTGQLVVHDDTEWLRDVVTRLTDHHERGRPHPWQVSDAPPAYIAAQLNGIVGIELAITAVQGAAKMSQNRPERDRDGVIAGLRESPEPADHAVAQRVSQWNGHQA